MELKPVDVLKALSSYFDTKKWDWERFGEGPEAHIGECYQVWKNPKNLWECGSVGLKNTPKSLYRLLYLFGPTIDFSDMYKKRLVVVASWDKQYAFEAYLFKYELGLYFYTKKLFLGGKGTGFIAGHPGADNNFHCTDKTGNLWFSVAEKMLNCEWNIYPGNFFSV